MNEAINTLNIPNHIAIIMDGNGRWAKARHLPRVAGHVQGVKRVREIVERCTELKVRYLTLFAFGRENWNRPQAEVSFLMKLLANQLDKEFLKLHTQNIRVRFLGDKSRINENLSSKIKKVEELTRNNTTLELNIALDYSGSYDILQAVNKIVENKLNSPITEAEFKSYLLTHPTPDPDLFIRTSGEYRLSNFMLLQLSYSELYFTDVCWPDFHKQELDKAIAHYSSRERRFGKISEQI